MNSWASQSDHRHFQLAGGGAVQSGSSFTELSGVSGWLLFVASDPQKSRDCGCDKISPFSSVIV